MDDWDHLLASSESLVHGVGLSTMAIDDCIMLKLKR